MQTTQEIPDGTYYKLLTFDGKCPFAPPELRVHTPGDIVIYPRALPGMLFFTTERPEVAVPLLDYVYRVYPREDGNPFQLYAANHVAPAKGPRRIPNVVRWPESAEITLELATQKFQAERGKTHFALDRICDRIRLAYVQAFYMGEENLFQQYL